MMILEGQKDIYMPVRSLAEKSGEAGIYLCENQYGGQFAARIYSNIEGISNVVRRFLYQSDHPYLLRLLDHGVSEIQGKKCAFEIFEYMPQGTLASLAPMDEYEVEKTVIPCLNEALHDMHEEGFLHRDVKPDNMYPFIGEDGLSGVKLGDFGITVHMGQNQNYCDAALAFTPGYAPAEVLGAGMYSPASDYYGLAVSLYYLLTGRQIYEGLSPDEIMIKTRRGELMQYEHVSKRMADLLEGLTVQDPRYRWGYSEVKAWMGGANVPVFRYSQEEQLLEVPYQLTAQIQCSSLRQLAVALSQYPEEGRTHLYDGLLADSLRRQYQHLSNALTDLTVNRFPHAHHAGLAAAIHLLDPAAEGFFWNGKQYKGLFALLELLRQEIAEGVLANSEEELLTSGILSYYYGNLLSEDDVDFLKKIEKEAQTRPFRAACEIVLKLLPEPVYQIQSEAAVKTVEEYIEFLEQDSTGLSERIYCDFNKEYFQYWLGAIGYTVAFREWQEFFYKGGRITQDSRLTGNVCQFFERICPQKQSVLRHFVLAQLQKEPEFWLKDHLHLYEMDEMMEHMVQENFSSIEYTEDMSISDLIRAQHEMKEYMHELRRDFLNNRFLYAFGVYDVVSYRIRSRYADAYFVLSADDELVPVGWLKECGGLKEKSLIQQGFSAMKEQAGDYLLQFAEKIRGWSKRCETTCMEMKKRRQVPGAVSGVAVLLAGVLCMAFLMTLSRSFLEGSGILTKAGFTLGFLSILWVMGAGIVRLTQFRLWKRLLRSISNLEEIAKDAEKLQEDLVVNMGIEAAGKGKETKAVQSVKTSGKTKRSRASKASEEWKKASKSSNGLQESDDGRESREIIQTAGYNLEMEAQEERAYSGYLSAYRKLKNGLLCCWFAFGLSAAVLGVGLYQDGAISLEKGSIVTQFQELFQKDVVNKEPKKDTNLTEQNEYTVTVSSARLRAGAGTSYEVLNSYENGIVVTATGKSQSDGSHIWYQVTTPDGTTGWMRDDTISPVK